MKKQLTGSVVSDRMDKTRVVEIVRSVSHPLYKKRYRVSKRFYAHDAENATRVGDHVVIEETRALSRLKRWRIIQKTQAGPSTVSKEGEERTKPDGPPKADERGKGKRRVSSQEKS